MAKRNFAERAWDDGETVKELVNHFEGSAILTSGNLIEAALDQPIKPWRHSLRDHTTLSKPLPSTLQQGRHQVPGLCQLIACQRQWRLS